MPNNIKAEMSDESEEKTLKVGNFSLRGSQQPGPLVGLGENIIDKGQIQFYLFANALIGNNNYRTDLIPSFLYGVTDAFSVFFNVPYTPKNKDGITKSKSSGLEDIFIQLEYAFYTKSNRVSTDQATIVSNVSFPTGSNTKNPPTGFGSPSFLLALTYNHTTINWLFFGATGIILPTKHDAFKVGNQFLYQGGVGRNICTPPGWIYAWIIEFIGQYSWKDTLNNHKDPNSGGNVFSIIPSLWISSEKLILQFGIGGPVIQHLFGNQSKQNLSLTFNFGWTF